MYNSWIYLLHVSVKQLLDKHVFYPQNQGILARLLTLKIQSIFIGNRCKHACIQTFPILFRSLQAPKKQGSRVYIFPVTRLEYLSGLFWAAELRGNWISCINLIPSSFGVWQRRILFWSQAVCAFHWTKWRNEVTKHWMDLCSVPFDVFARLWERRDMWDTFSSGKSWNPGRIYQIYWVLLDFIGIFCFKTCLFKGIRNRGCSDLPMVQLVV